MDKIVNGLKQEFSVPFAYDVLFTRDLFNQSNDLILNCLCSNENEAVKVIIVIDKGVCDSTPDLLMKIQQYFGGFRQFNLLRSPIVVAGGEDCKNDFSIVTNLLEQINSHGLDRHSYLIAIGGGAVLDMVGFTAAIAHRGIRHVRIPTTVLSQNDSGVGVKNGVNLFGKKNFIGCFSPPELVINDIQFLRTLSDRDWLSGISEAIKVALIKDLDFFEYLEEHASRLVERDEKAMEYVVHRCAELHLNHIASGDPFEKGSSRPLDFGHWSAHKLEQISNFEIRHGEAVAIGIALDTIYSNKIGFLNSSKTQRILDLINSLGLPIFCSELLMKDNNECLILKGLTEFQEHIGGELTIMMLKDIGLGFEINDIDNALMEQAMLQLKRFDEHKITNESKAVI